MNGKTTKVFARPVCNLPLTKALVGVAARPSCRRSLVAPKSTAPTHATGHHQPVDTPKLRTRATNRDPARPVRSSPRNFARAARPASRTSDVRRKRSHVGQSAASFLLVGVIRANGYVIQASVVLVRTYVERIERAGASTVHLSWLLPILDCHSLPDHHPCTHPCHAPSTCPETTACTAIVSLKCPCGRIQRPVPCSKSVLQPNGQANRSSLQPRCTNECAVAQRNARLAEAFGIASPAQGTEVGRERMQAVYPVEIQGFAKANIGFLGVVEKALAEYVLFCLKVGRC